MRFLSSSSKPHILLCSGPPLPSASASPKTFPAQLGPPLPCLLASLQHLSARPYSQGSPLRAHHPRQFLTPDLTERFGPPPACCTFNFLSSMAAAVCRRNALAWLPPPTCPLVDLQLYVTSTHNNS